MALMMVLRPRCLQVENENVLKSMKACVSETLSTLGQHFGQLLELALTQEVQVSAWCSRGEGTEWLSQVGSSSQVAFLGRHPLLTTKVTWSICETKTVGA
jgi:hypothetical protein